MSVENILKWYDLSSKLDRSQGKGWYQSALNECKALANRFNVELDRVIYAVAALSPQLKWELNIKAARVVLSGRVRGSGAYDANVEKALHILQDDDDWQRWLSGNKVTSFAANIAGDPDTVTVDTWAWRVWADTKLNAKVPNLDKLYFQIAADYREAAARIGLAPRELQAVVWVTIRRLANGKAAPGQLTLDM
jgi:hypothetical protein